MKAEIDINIRRKKMKKLVIVRNEHTKGKNKFYSYFTIMNLPEVKGGEAVKHSVTVKFRKDVDVSAFGKRGVITVSDKDISAPFIYEITKDENGNDVYPTIWIRGYNDYQRSSKSPITQDMFVLDEEETEEVEFES